MAAFNKFQDFAEQLGKEVHQLHSDTLKVYLTNTAPNAATHAVKTDLAEISAGNGYTSGGHDTQNTYTESGGTASCVGTDIVITASGGSVGPFRYVVLYNDDAASDNLIGWWDYGSSITLSAGESFTIDFGSSLFTVA